MKTEVGGTTVVNDIIAVDYSKTEVDYVLTGSGEYTEGKKAAMADTKATVIDATGLSNAVPMALASVNPNCLFLVSDATKLSNEKNVVV